MENEKQRSCAAPPAGCNASQSKIVQQIFKRFKRIQVGSAEQKLLGERVHFPDCPIQLRKRSAALLWDV